MTSTEARALQALSFYQRIVRLEVEMEGATAAEIAVLKEDIAMYRKEAKQAGYSAAEIRASGKAWAA